jgi:hypothetical protein
MAQANAIYEAVLGATFERVRVEWPEFEQYRKELRLLRRATTASREEGFWDPGLRHLSNASFLIASTPLVSHSPDLGLLSLLTRAREAFADAEAIYPEVVPTLESACAALFELILAGRDYLSDAIVELVAARRSNRLAVVLPSLAMDLAAQKHLRARPRTDDKLDVVTPRELLERKPLDTLVVTGTPAMYVRRGWDWIFTAPRAREIVVLGFGKDASQPLPPLAVFPSSQIGMRERDVPLKDADEHAELEEQGEDLELDWHVVPAQFLAGQGSTPAELVDARLFLLADGFRVFLQQEANVTVIDPDALPQDRIQSIGIDEIGVETFVLLRSSGGGDLVVSVADKILGGHARELRTMQAEWKHRLNELIGDVGIDVVAARLSEQGATRASRQNIRNWAAPRSLRTLDFTDFRAIMEVTGLGDQAAGYWSAMDHLEGAHRRAGLEIREQLEKQAEQADLSRLDELGRLDFTLAAGGGALTAFRVEAVSFETVRVPYTTIGWPIEAEL